MAIRLVLLRDLKQAAVSNPLKLGSAELEQRLEEAERNRHNEGKTPIEFAIPVVGKEIADRLSQ